MTVDSIFNWQDLFDSPAARQVEIHPANPYLSDGVLRCGNAEKCAAIELKRSHSRSSGSQTVELILLLKGLAPEVMDGSFRISICKDTTQDELDQLYAVITEKLIPMAR